jgi:Ethanolamine utilization protein EutJ (predicted chaperonin)
MSHAGINRGHSNRAVADISQHGTTRPVLGTNDCRQYVLDDDGQPVYGVWLWVDANQDAQLPNESA